MAKAEELPVGTNISLYDDRRGWTVMTKIVDEEKQEIWIETNRKHSLTRSAKDVVFLNDELDAVNYKILSLSDPVPDTYSNGAPIMLCHSCLAFLHIRVPAVTMYEGEYICADHALGRVG